MSGWLRRIAAVLLALSMLATSAEGWAQSSGAPGSATVADDAGGSGYPADAAPSRAPDVTTTIIAGAAIVAGAFVVGVVAAGTATGGLVAAGAAAWLYASMP